MNGYPVVSDTVMAQVFAQAVTLLETTPRYVVTIKLRGSVERVETFAANSATEATDRVASWYQNQAGRTYEARLMVDFTGAKQWSEN